MQKSCLDHVLTHQTVAMMSSAIFSHSNELHHDDNVIAAVLKQIWSRIAGTRAKESKASANAPADQTADGVCNAVDDDNDAAVSSAGIKELMDKVAGFLQYAPADIRRAAPTLAADVPTDRAQDLLKELSVVRKQEGLAVNKQKELKAACVNLRIALNG